MTQPIRIQAGQAPDQPWNTAWGKVGTPVTSTSYSQAVTSATLVDLTGLTVTFNAVANRQYKMTVGGLICVETVANGILKAFITDSSNNILANIAESSLSSAVPGTRCTLGGIYINPASITGSTTWKLRASISAGGTATLSGDSGSQISILVEDCGPL